MRRILLSLCLLFLCVAAAQSSQYYTDLPRSHWAYETVEKMSEKGFLTGTADKKFNGDSVVTRYGMAQIVANILSRAEYISNVEKQPLTQDELMAIEELVAEFADELTLMCVKYDGLRADLAEIKGDLSAAKKDLNRFKQIAGNDFRKDKLSFGGDFRLRHTDAVKTANAGDNVHANAYLRLKFNAQVDENTTAHVRWTAYDYNYGLPAGSLVSANRVDNAYLEFREALRGRGTLRLGRKYTSCGHYMVLHGYADAVTYETNNGDTDIVMNAIFDRAENRDFYQIWNLNVSKDFDKSSGYLGIYTRSLPNTSVVPIYTDRGMDIIEAGSRGTISKEKGLSYDLAIVYASNDRKNAGKEEKIAGYMKHAAINWAGKKDFGAKIAYTDADDEFDGILTIDNETRYLGGPETPFEDVAFFLGGMTGGVAGGKQKFYNTSDLKLQLDYAPNSSKHYFRVAFDKVKELKDNVSNDFAGVSVNNLNALGYNKLDMDISTFEYRYSLADNTKLRFGYTMADKGDCLDSTNSTVSDENLLWTEIISTF